MNGSININSKAEIRKVVIDVLTGFTVNTDGLITSHDEALTKAGAEQIWDRLTTRGLKIIRDE